MNKKIVGVVFGSEKDLDHVHQVTGALRNHGWTYFPWDSSPDVQKSYTVAAGSVHRDNEGTLERVRILSNYARHFDDKLIFLTCIGLNDDASGTISSQTGRRVIVLSPDVKVYSKYPSGVRVYTFSTKPNRSRDTERALEWLDMEFDNPNWSVEDANSEAARETARDNLKLLREKIERGEIEF